MCSIFPLKTTILVPRAGIEPARPLFTKAADFKSAVSTNFTIGALLRSQPTKKGSPSVTLASLLEFGAGKESRTLDLNLGKVALYQLSYSRMRR